MVKTFTEEEVEMFAEISGDRNPIHFDPDYAAGTRYERPIVHGVLTVGLLSAVMGMQCPGPGNITLYIYNLDNELLMTRLTVGISHNNISENLKTGNYATFQFQFSHQRALLKIYRYTVSISVSVNSIHM